MILDVNVLPNVLTILGVIASFLIAVFAVLLGINSNKQISKIRKDEKREHNLRDIINWAIKILEYGRGPDALERNSITYLRTLVNILTWEAVYIGFLAEDIDKGILKPAVEKTRTLLRQHIKVLDLARDKKLKDNAAVGRHRNKLDDSARIVIEIATALL